MAAMVDVAAASANVTKVLAFMMNSNRGLR
jgi:hypothetical protein